MALFKNRTFAGSIKIATNGNRPCTTRILTPAASTTRIALMTGPTTVYPRIASSIPMIPAEKLLISISKPAGIWPSIASSNFLIQKPPNGPMIMAAISIVMDVSLIMAPITAIAPTTRPLSPPTILPPVDAIRIGIK